MSRSASSSATGELWDFEKLISKDEVDKEIFWLPLSLTRSKFFPKACGVESMKVGEIVPISLFSLDNPSLEVDMKPKMVTKEPRLYALEPFIVTTANNVLNWKGGEKIGFRISEDRRLYFKVLNRGMHACK